MGKFVVHGKMLENGRCAKKENVIKKNNLSQNGFTHDLSKGEVFTKTYILGYRVFLMCVSTCMGHF
jgi:hypothetical protein